MEGIISKYIFLIGYTVIVLFFIRSILIKKNLKKYFYISVILFLVFWIYISIFKVMKDVKEYNSYNQLKINEVTKIVINDKEINKTDKYLLFEELKFDKFTWANHPIVIDTDTIKVFTNVREYKFIIENTENQGLLVIRIDKNNNSYVTNMNDSLLRFMSNTSMKEEDKFNDDELYHAIDSVSMSKKSSAAVRSVP
jgi:hypothetical protein